jgi:hypothetical protein
MGFGPFAAFTLDSGVGGFEFVLSKTGERGPRYMTLEAERIESMIRDNPSSFEPAGDWQLPDGSTLTLFEIWHGDAKPNPLPDPPSV